MARTPSDVTSTAAKPARKVQKASDRKLYVVLNEGVDASAFKGMVVLENMSAGNPKPFVILKLASSPRGQAGEATVETSDAPAV